MRNLFTSYLIGGTLLIAAAGAPSAYATSFADDTHLVREIKTANALLGVDYSPDGKRIATCGLGRDIVIWSVETGKPVLTLKGHTDDVVTVRFSPNGRYLASGGVDKKLILWDAITGDQLRQTTDHTDYVRDVAFSPDSKLVASAGWDGFSYVWETFSGVRVAALGAKAGGTGGYDKTRTTKGRSANMTSVAFSPDGTELLTASGDHLIRGWDTQGWQAKYTLTGHDDEVWDARYSPNGRFVVSGAWDNTCRVWDVRTRQLTYTLPAHISDVWATAFSPDGQLIASGGGDRKVKIWDMATGGLVEELNGEAHTAEVENLAFSPDGLTLASVSRDGSLKIWRVPTIADRAAAYVLPLMAKWEKKGEFEKTDEYQSRMANKLKKPQEFRQAFQTKMLTAYDRTAAWQRFELGDYNADTEQFQVVSPQFAGRYVLKVSPREAGAVREHFSEAKYRTPVFELTPDDQISLRTTEVMVNTGTETRALILSR
ncbi:MAG: WD40 repeat domain-containing protein [Hymenobacteraceae bacterium]|nr:WD40 repeat domain-containing protein [Hymenobacteraceae bacterium]